MYLIMNKCPPSDGEKRATTTLTVMPYEAIRRNESLGPSCRHIFTRTRGAGQQAGHGYISTWPHGRCFAQNWSGRWIGRHGREWTHLPRSAAVRRRRSTSSA